MSDPVQTMFDEITKSATSAAFKEGLELGKLEYERDKFRGALEQIASYEISDGLNYYNARAMIEAARRALGRD